LLGPVDEDTDVVDLTGELVAQLEVVGETAATLERLLRVSSVFPEIRSGDALF
jgi:hypothetical protein